MRDIVLDTNCLLQMLSRRSPAYKAWLAYQREQYKICVSNDILNEYHEILAEHASLEVADNVISLIMHSPCTRFIDPHFHFNMISADPDDNKFVDCAVIANADYIVTDDEHFKVLEMIKFPPVCVKKLEMFLDDLNENNNP